MLGHTGLSKHCRPRTDAGLATQPAHFKHHCLALVNSADDKLLLFFLFSQITGSDYLHEMSNPVFVLLFVYENMLQALLMSTHWPQYMDKFMNKSNSAPARISGQRGAR